MKLYLLGGVLRVVEKKMHLKYLVWIGQHHAASWDAVVKKKGRALGIKTQKHVMCMKDCKPLVSLHMRWRLRATAVMESGIRELTSAEKQM